jgi:FixJ family two-component response regulator
MSSLQTPDQPSEHVFLVDDDDALRDGIADLLRVVGYQVYSWSDGAAFLADIPRVAPAVLITDMRMPGLSGVELHAELLRLGRTLPVIYISGESTVAQSIQAMKLGAVEFLIKPFGREELLRAVATSLEKDRQQMQLLIKAARVAQARAQLSPREVQVHELMLKGYNNREIMDSLQISLPTAKQYKAEVMRKLAVRSLSELISLSATEPAPSSPRR